MFWGIGAQDPDAELDARENIDGKKNSADLALVVSASLDTGTAGELEGYWSAAAGTPDGCVNGNRGAGPEGDLYA